MRVPLDLAGVHAIEVQRAGDGLLLSLGHGAGDRRSRTHESLLRQLRFRVGSEIHRLGSSDGQVTLTGDEVAILLAFATPGVEPVHVATLARAETGETVVRSDAPRYLLSPFELRYAADNGVLHDVPLRAREPSAWSPTTDLHAHFAGCVRGTDLVRLGIEHGITYPRALLTEARIHAETDVVSIAELSPSLQERLAARLEVPLDRRVTFLEMERIYRLRGPITKSPPLLLPLCRQIAEDYRAMGVTYAELSLGSIVEARVLTALHRGLPAIEATTGVTLRFLAALSRHDDPEWDLDVVDRIASLAGSVYLSGIDVMGHETNSTHVFAPILRAVATWADRARPGFVVRVHAGESPAHPENVRLAVEATRGHAVELRIGHGLYGVDDDTLAAIVDARALVEFNLDSNVALNHLQSARAVPIRRYVEAGARVVLGSDGYGLYQTSPRSAAHAALIAGLDREQLETVLAETERSWLTEARTRDAERLEGASTFDVPDDRPPFHFTPAVVARRHAARAARDRALEERLAATGTVLVDDVAHLLGTTSSAKRIVISIAGAWTRSWSSMTDAERAHASRELTALVEGLEPEEAILVTGGTREGVEGIVGRCAVARGFLVLAALVRETPPDVLDASAMTHALFVGETLYDKAEGLYRLVSAHHGVCVFVGGGQIVSDEIQTASNAKLRYLLMDGVGGASARHAREQPSRAFSRASEALHLIRSWAESTIPDEVMPHWYVGANPTVDAVVLRRVGDDRELLLVLRDRDAPAEAGKWALPGGFVASTTHRGSHWSAAETAEAACIRELGEEAGIVVAVAALAPLGVFEGGGRDPRDTPRSWSRSMAFRIELDADAPATISGGDDAGDARWFPLDRPLPLLAFDHARIVEAALASAQ